MAPGDLAEDIARLKSEPGKDIVAHGGVRFARSLAASGLVDDYRLLTHPVSLGRGIALFGELARPLPAGVVTNVLRPVAARKT